jgi:alpha-1,3-rhamnosyl/mannosyltransferase
MTAKRIAFDARLVLDKPTGIGQYVVSLLQAMASAAPDRRFLILRGPDPWADYGLEALDLPNTEHVIVRTRRMSLPQHWELPRLLRRLAPDVFHYPHFDAPLLTTVPYVASIHDVTYLAMRELFPRFGPAKIAYMRGMFRATLRRAARTLVPSAATASDLARMFGNGGRIQVVPYGVDEIFRPAAKAELEKFRREHSLSRPFVLCVGEFRPHKNHAALLRAWSRTRAREDHDLVLVGQRHPGGVDPEALAREAGVSVRVLSALDRPGLVAAYTAADLFALVSRYEGFGFPALEAMACGTPVLASRTTSLGEVVGKGGVTVDPEDEAAIAEELDRLLRDSAERAQLTERGYARCAEFHWKRTAEETLAVYDEVVTRS